MSDDRIIDFNDLKNKVKDSDVDKFEQYIYNLYFSVMDGSMTMAEFSRKIYDYMRENNISQEKFINQLKSFCIDPSVTWFSDIDLNNLSNENIENIRKSAGFYEKYGSKIQPKSCISSSIKNDTNDIEIMIDQEKVMLYSNKKINLMDAELNEFLLAYKNMFNKKIRVVLCENYSEYDY